MGGAEVPRDPDAEAPVVPGPGRRGGSASMRRREGGGGGGEGEGCEGRVPAAGEFGGGESRR